MFRSLINRKAWYLLAALAVLLLLLVGCSGKETKYEPVTSMAQLNSPDRKIGVSSDTTEDKLVMEKLPLAQIEYVKDNVSAYTAVAQGKLDAFVYDKRQMEIAVETGLKGVKILDETLGEGNQIAIPVSPKTKIPDLKEKLNAFIAEIKADGTLDDMRRRWLTDGDETMPDIPVPEKSEIHLTVGTSGSAMPYSYYVGDQLNGLDIEQARRFAAWLGATLEFKVYSYDGIVAACLAGDVDCVMANLFVTEERKESIQFSDPTFVIEIGAMVRDTDDESASSAGPKYTALSDLEFARIGVTTGSVQAQMAEERFPEAKLQYFTTDVDMLNALRTKKIDAYVSAEALVRYTMSHAPDLTCLEETLGGVMQVCAIFPKTDSGRAFRDEYNAFLYELRQSGEYEEILNIWFGEDEEKRVPLDLDDLPAENGILRMAADLSFVPFVYIKGENPAGIDVEIAYRFCKANGYGLELVPMDFAGIIPAVVTGKADFAGGGIAYTAERAESVFFSDPTYEGSSVVAVLKNPSATPRYDFWLSVRESLFKTFIREDRWKLFLSGIGTTLLITILSILFGTVLGFLVFMLCRRGSRIANAVTRFFVWLLEGMPVVVLLMILYYVIFGSVAISGTLVSVICFTLLFGASVYSMIKGGTSAIDRGQTEAALTLGYTDTKAFYRIVLPQALPYIMPNYKAQITSTIKATAVVGYIAVQDLTKIGDIIRSRTYEAFFPLIVVAVFYFVLAGLLTHLANKLEVRIDPKQRSREDILKGVKTGD